MQQCATGVKHLYINLSEYLSLLSQQKDLLMVLEELTIKVNTDE
jgi:hypothetical protein